MAQLCALVLLCLFLGLGPRAALHATAPAQMTTWQNWSLLKETNHHKKTNLHLQFACQRRDCAPEPRSLRTAVSRSCRGPLATRGVCIPSTFCDT